MFLLIWFLFHLVNSTWQTNRLPDDFLVGFATASYQVEGAWNEDGKGESVWDRLAHTKADLIVGESNGDVATDQYHKIDEDVRIMKNLGAQVYRFSMSWSRIYPSIENYDVNHAGIMYYQNLISKLVENNIQPMVTLFHWDLPQYLQDLGGWTNEAVIDYYEDFARVAFQEFGQRVKYWITFNEPLETCMEHYGGVDGAPLINMSGIADYMCAHSILKAHARVYHLYNDTFKPVQKGLVGITLNGGWNEPLTNSSSDITAAETMNLFQIGWFADPIFGVGDYPKIMRINIDRNSKSEGRMKSRLPQFDPDTVNYIRGTFDFYGLNHYTTKLATAAQKPVDCQTCWQKDVGVALKIDPQWPRSASAWLRVVPWGFRRLLNFVKTRYGNVPVIVTENGFSDSDGLNDADRINYYHDYLEEMLKAMYSDGCNVKGYVAWSILDNFEWMRGYSERFGVVYVNFSDPSRKRTLKASASFLKDFYTTRELPAICNSRNSYEVHGV